MTSSSTTPSCLTLDISGAIARIDFNRPASLNAINVEMAVAFQAAIQTIASTPTLRVVLLRGQGRAFMAGGDLAEMQGDSAATARKIIVPLHAGLLQMANLPMPVLASVHGAAAGAGLSIMLAADLAIAADTAVFNMAYAKIAASPDASGSWHLPRVVGLRKAMEIALLSDTIDASEALRLSLVNRVVPADALEAETEALVQRLAAGPTGAYGRIKNLMRHSLQRDLHGQLQAEQGAFEAGATTADFKEGLAAFLGKRAPVYSGT
jgi:2-(1,2-epoxy-1,2-dihydrophenyl)acetyl-CoA isomerase